MLVLGLDIGGANLKLADSQGHCVSQAFAIWKTPDRLAAALRSLEASLIANSKRAAKWEGEAPAELWSLCDSARLIGSAGASPSQGPQSINEHRESLEVESLTSSAAILLAVTMTAELADCFETKAEGVRRILTSVQDVAGSRPVLVWMTDGSFAAPELAITQPLLAAASNWQALATWAARWVDGAPALLIDIGTTTTDLIPIDSGLPSTIGYTDATRLMAGELVYTGIRRTPLCAVAPAVPFQGTSCPLAAEWFATTLDVHLLLGNLAEDPTDIDTANGRPATISAAHDRLARQLCCDRLELTADEAIQIAADLASRQRNQITAALDLVLRNREPRQAVIISGSGSFLARQIIAVRPQLKSARVVDLNETLSPELATAACAYAVAVLAKESQSVRTTRQT